MSIASMFDLTGQVALVTGAAAGLGLEICDVLAEAGADVVCADIDEDRLGAAVAQVERHGPRALPVRCDVADEEDVAGLFEAAAARFDHVDILVNNAGIADPVAAAVHEYRTEHWQRVLRVNLDGVFFCSRAALQTMVERKRGKIINIASIWGLTGGASLFPIPAYSAAKGAVVNLTREMALEYAPKNIQVNAICPGFYHTTLGNRAYDDPSFVEQAQAATPMGRIAEASEIRGPALFLASSASDFVTGLMLVADGGYTAM